MQSKIKWPKNKKNKQKRIGSKTKEPRPLSKHLAADKKISFAFQRKSSMVLVMINICHCQQCQVLMEAGQAVPPEPPKEETNTKPKGKENSCGQTSATLQVSEDCYGSYAMVDSGTSAILLPCIQTSEVKWQSAKFPTLWFVDLSFKLWVPGPDYSSCCSPTSSHSYLTSG